jgi:predicted phage-related endonuclease
MSVSIDHIAAHVEVYKHAKAKADEFAAAAQRSREKIEEALGENEIGTVDGEPVVRWSHQKVNRLDQKALKEDHPEIVAEYTKLHAQRRFEVIG